MVWVEILLNWKNLKNVIGDGALSEWSDARIEPDLELSLFYDEDDELIAAVCETRRTPLVVVSARVTPKEIDRLVSTLSAPVAIKALARRCVVSDNPFPTPPLVWWSGDCRDMPDTERPQLLAAVKRRDVAIVQKVRKTLNWGDGDDWVIQSAEDLVRHIDEGADVHRYDEFVAVGVPKQVSASPPQSSS